MSAADNAKNWAQALTTDRIVGDLYRLASNVRFHTGHDREALLTEAATRLGKLGELAELVSRSVELGDAAEQSPEGEQGDLHTMRAKARRLA